MGGCVGSRLEESEVVTLCRDRVRNLSAAGDYRYALADAHASYIHLLRSVGGSLHRFFVTTYPPPSLTPPTHMQSPPRSSSLRVDSDSHLQFNSSDDHTDDGDEDEDEACLNSHQLHSIDESATSKTETCLNFTKKDVPVSTALIYDAGEGGMSRASYACPPTHSNPSTYDGFIESSLPPPLPPPPQSSSWDFLNPFDFYQIHQQMFTFSQSSRDLREEEGIPDLEDEEYNTFMTGSDNVEKIVNRTSSLKKNSGDLISLSKDDMVGEDEGRRSIGREKENNIFADRELQQQSNGGQQSKLALGSRSSLSDVMHEINVNFEEASVFCKEICRILEVGKLPYHKRQYNVISSKVRHAMTINSSPSAMKNDDGFFHLDFDGEKGMKSGNLSSTLQKLYVWEKKQYEEVKAVEVMQLCHNKKCNMLKQLYDKGAEAPKIDSMRDAVMKLSTKIIITIEVVESISKMINKLRDEELWPKLHELIEGLAKMWQNLTKCHRNQFQAIIESNHMDAVARKFDDEHMKLTMQLALDLLKWIEIFSFWINAQKSYVRSLNDWLMKCLPSDREETVDGLVPFSPGRLGAPLVFVICNDWFHAMANVTEQEVVEAIELFTGNVMQIWNRHYEARLDGMNANKGNDRQIKALGKEDQQFWKAVDALNKNQSITIHLYNDKAHTITKPIGLQEALRNIFKALERFSENYARIYEELCIRCNQNSITGNTLLG